MSSTQITQDEWHASRAVRDIARERREVAAALDGAEPCTTRGERHGQD